MLSEVQFLSLFLPHISCGIFLEQGTFSFSLFTGICLIK